MAGDQLPRELASEDRIDNDSKEIATRFLIKSLQPVREFEVSPAEITSIIEDGSLTMRLILKESLAEIKANFSILGFNAA